MTTCSGLSLCLCIWAFSTGRGNLLCPTLCRPSAHHEGVKQVRPWNACAHRACAKHFTHHSLPALTVSQGRELPVLVSCQCDIGGGLTAFESPPAPTLLPGEGRYSDPMWPNEGCVCSGCVNRPPWSAVAAAGLGWLCAVHWEKSVCVVGV